MAASSSRWFVGLFPERLFFSCLVPVSQAWFGCRRRVPQHTSDHPYCFAPALFQSMFGPLLFGLHHHFLVISPDHVHSQPASPWGTAFIFAAYGLLITEAFGTYVGIHFLWVAKENSNKASKSQVPLKMGGKSQLKPQAGDDSLIRIRGRLAPPDCLRDR